MVARDNASKVGKEFRKRLGTRFAMELTDRVLALDESLQKIFFDDVATAMSERLKVLEYVQRKRNAIDGTNDRPKT